MLDPEFFRAKAQRCRDLLKIAVRPEIIEQLETWTHDFEEEAEKAEAQMARAGAEQASLSRRRSLDYS